MNIGDLICYNACGMKNKTLGLILDTKWSKGLQLYLIQWSVIGKFMPQSNYREGSDIPYQTWGIKPSIGEMWWHKHGDWFEVVK